MHTKRITRHLSYANLMATIGVFIALGGASYATVAIPANSVGTNQLKKSAVGGSKIKKNAISSAKVKDGSLQRGDFANGTLLQGPQGAQGLQGPKGDPGTTGSPGLSGVEQVAAKVVNTSPTRREVLYPQCPAGKRVIAAGGAVLTGPGDEGKVILTEAFPLGTGVAQVVAEEVAGTNPTSWSLTGYATCANVQ